MTAHVALAQTLPRTTDYSRLKEHLIAVTGLAYYRDKDDELASHLARRMAQIGLTDCTSYLERLQDTHLGATELDTLATSLTIGETFFFRHGEVFEALRTVVFPALLEQNATQRRLRIWSAGCAIGAEAYSLSIMLARDFGERLAGWDISVLGTDINREFLAQAQRGEYGEWSMRATPPEVRGACFDRVGAQWRLRDEFRRVVSFRYHNLVQHHFPSVVSDLSSFDLILCRNVMIYFEATVVQRLVEQFRHSLVEGGWFIVGHAEPNVEVYREFRTVNAPSAILYQRAPAGPAVMYQPGAWPNIEPALNFTVAPTKPPAAMLPATAAKVLPAPSVRPRIAAPVPATVTLSTVRAALDRGEWEWAGEACRKLAVKERLSPILYFYEALVAQQTSHYAAAEAALKRALYLDRDFLLAHYYLGLMQQRNRDARAERSFRNVLALLTTRKEAEALPDADGLTVGELKELAEMQLELVTLT